MDAFAENQMGRNDEANNSMLDVTQAAAIQAKRLRRSSKEQEMDAVAVEVCSTPRYVHTRRCQTAKK